MKIYLETEQLMVHEIRNYLTLIRSTSQLLEQKLPSLKDTSDWNQLTNDINDMCFLTQNYCSYLGNSDLTMISSDFICLLEQIYETSLAMATEKGIQFTLDVSELSAAELHHYSCDSLKLKESFLNIIKNALEATSEHEYIHVKGSIAPEKNNFYIHISNNGEKIPSENIAYLFSPDFTTKTYGTGLGLAMTNHIIQEHGGSLSVTSDENETVFTITLPFQSTENISI